MILIIIIIIVIIIMCVFWLNSVGAGHTGDPEKNVLETLFWYLIKRGGVTDTSSLVCHRQLSTLVFTTENK